MNRIENRNYKLETYEINKISLSCFVYKTYILDNEIDVLALGYLSGL